MPNMTIKTETQNIPKGADFDHGAGWGRLPPTPPMPPKAPTPQMPPKPPLPPTLPTPPMPPTPPTPPTPRRSASESRDCDERGSKSPFLSLTSALNFPKRLSGKGSKEMRQARDSVQTGESMVLGSGEEHLGDPRWLAHVKRRKK